jgi:putative ABC transport system ATP-binding protein
MGDFVSFANVSKIYKQGDVETHALSDVSFGLDEGDFCVIVGPSGAGKTTLLNILGGIDTATLGDITLGDRKISKMNLTQLTTYRRYDVGFVFQFYNLVANLTALENVELASEICDDPLDPEEVLGLVGLSNRVNNFPAQLSGGEQQRVAIARAIAKNPKLLLCDEPTGALDDSTGKQILELLSETNKEKGMTIILITHNSEITKMADKIIRVRDGKIASIEVNKEKIPASELNW